MKNVGDRLDALTADGGEGGEGGAGVGGGVEVAYLEVLVEESAKLQNILYSMPTKPGATPKAFLEVYSLSAEGGGAEVSLDLETNGIEVVAPPPSSASPGGGGGGGWGGAAGGGDAGREVFVIDDD